MALQSSAKLSDRRPTGDQGAVAVLHLQLAAARDVVEMGAQVARVARATGDLDHHLRRPAGDASQAGPDLAAGSRATQRQDRACRPARRQHWRAPDILEAADSLEIAHGATYQ